MPLWRTKALQLLREAGVNPDRWEYCDLRAADNPYMLWIELSFHFEQAHDNDPPDFQFIAKVYEYGFWCLTAAPRGHGAESDPFTAAYVSFFEHLPTRPRVRELMHRYIPSEEFEKLQPAFRYLLSEPELAKFNAEMRERYRRQQRVSKPARRS